MDYSLKNKTILITGGAGYLGSFLVKSLREKGADVYNISKEAVASEHDFPVDITNFDELDPIIQQINPDIVYHLAANISRNRNFSIFENMLQVNVIGTFNLLESLKQTDYKQFIFTSTSEIYGNNASPFHEDLLPMPVSPYSLTKVMAEQLIKTFSQQYNRNYTILRLFNFYGKNMSEDFFISQMINNLRRGEDFLMTKGEQKRDFIFVEDVVRALILAAEKPDACNETFNVCSGVGSPLASLATMINIKIDGTAKVKIGALPYRENEVWEMIGTTTKSKEKLGFIPHYSLNDGLEKILKMND